MNDDPRPREPDAVEPFTERLRDTVASFDNSVDDVFAPLRGKRAVDWVFYVASETADYSRAWHVISASMALLSPSRRADSARLAVMLGIESVLVNGVIKRIVDRERPPQLDDRTFEVRRPNTKSFPSGHASSAALTAVLLSEAAPKLKPLWWGLAATVSASRIHNRMHHGSDVAAGAALGTLFAVAAKKIWPLR